MKMSMFVFWVINDNIYLQVATVIKPQDQQKKSSIIVI